MCLPPSMVYLTCTNLSRQKANWRERETRDRQISLSPSFTLSLPHSLSLSLQIYKATADVTSGQLLYDKYSTVADDHLVLRDIVMSRKMPRRLFVQPHTSINNGNEGCKYVLFLPPLDCL